MWTGRDTLMKKYSVGQTLVDHDCRQRRLWYTGARICPNCGAALYSKSVTQEIRLSRDDEQPHEPTFTWVFKFRSNTVSGGCLVHAGLRVHVNLVHVLRVALPRAIPGITFSTSPELGPHSNWIQFADDHDQTFLQKVVLDVAAAELNRIKDLAVAHWNDVTQGVQSLQQDEADLDNDMDLACVLDDEDLAPVVTMARAEACRDKVVSDQAAFLVPLERASRLFLVETETYPEGAATAGFNGGDGTKARSKAYMKTAHRGRLENSPHGRRLKARVRITAADAEPSLVKLHRGLAWVAAELQYKERLIKNNLAAIDLDLATTDWTPIFRKLRTRLAFRKRMENLLRKLGRGPVEMKTLSKPEKNFLDRLRKKGAVARRRGERWASILLGSLVDLLKECGGEPVFHDAGRWRDQDAAGAGDLDDFLDYQVRLGIESRLSTPRSDPRPR